MNPMPENVAISENYLAVDGERHVPLANLYLHRLHRLLQVEASANSWLVPDEQHQLRTSALLSTVRTLTAMGEGPAASQLLRSVTRR